MTAPAGVDRVKCAALLREMADCMEKLAEAEAKKAAADAEWLRNHPDEPEVLAAFVDGSWVVETDAYAAGQDERAEQAGIEL